jgi:hypothetical protein
MRRVVGEVEELSNPSVGVWASSNLRFAERINPSISA